MLRSLASIALLISAAPALAQEPGAAPVPEEVTALAGCWQGTGQIMGKPVTVALTAGPITQGAFFLIETDSRATADPADRHTTHLIFGGKTPTPDGESLYGFWADSFGGDYASVGGGSVRPDGFEVTYPYPDARFINTWARDGDALGWTIIADDGQTETVFARIALARADCSAAP